MSSITVVKLKQAYPLHCDLCSRWACAREERAMESHPHCRMIEETLRGYELLCSRQSVEQLTVLPIASFFA